MKSSEVPIQPTERFLHVGDTALNVVEWPGDGPPLVMIHGWGVAWQVWLSTAPRLARDFRVIACDLRGHGRSGRIAPDHERLTWVRDTAKLIETVAPSGAYVVGHSHGGWISLMLPSIAPGLAKKIVAEDPFTGPNSLVGERTKGDPNRTPRPDADFLESVTSIDPIIEHIRQNYSDYGDEVLERLATMQFRMDPDVIRGRGTRNERDRSWDDEFSKINCPVLLMHGNPEKGAIMDADEAARVAALIPDARISAWPRIGHNIHIARNFDFVKAVKRFLLED